MPRLPAAERRRQLLEVAAELFSKHGYRGTTTAALAEAAGVTEPILYRHFANKLDLFVSLIEEVGHEVVRSWRAALDGADDPEEKLNVLLAGNPAVHARGRDVYRVIFQAMTDAHAEPDIAKAIRGHMKELHGFLRRELKRLQDAGVVRDDEPASGIAWMLISTAIGYSMLLPSIGSASRGPGGRAAMQRLVHDVVS